MNTTRLNQLEKKMANWINASCKSEHVCVLPAFQNLVRHLNNQVESLPDSALTQQRLQEYEKLLVTIKASPALRNCQPVLNGKHVPVVVETADPWDDFILGEKNGIEQERFNKVTFEKALAFYGLPKNWERTFSVSKDTGHLRQNHPEVAAKDGLAVWTQANIPYASTGLRTAQIKEIEIVRNITLDFEYAPAPMKVHALALELREWLVSKGYADPGLPVEDSGAGAHIILPINDIKTAEIEGGPERINQAIIKIVRKHFSPIFEQSAELYGLKGKLSLDCFNINRIISMPGTFRPMKKEQEGQAYYGLKDGYQRRWLAPFDTESSIPSRVPSSTLTLLVQQTCVEIGNEEKSAIENVINLENYRKEGNTLKEKQAESYARVAYEGNLDELRNTTEGGRNNKLNKVAFRIGQLIAAGLPIWESTAFTDLVAAAMQAGLPRSEAQTTAEKALSKGLGKPASIELKEFEAS